MGAPKKTHCKRGHELTPENTYSNSNKRHCKLCRSEQSKKRQILLRKELTEYTKRWRRNNPKRVRVSERKYSLRLLGWTPETVEKALKEQNGTCAVCCRKPEGKWRKGLQADHAHTVPPVPRGLLCSWCNRGLGMFFDNPEVLRSAAAYLEKYKQGEYHGRNKL